MPIKTINNPRFQEIDENGEPLDGGLLYTYIAGTTTDKATYSDIELATPNGNPIELDSDGMATIFGQGAYKFVMKTSADVTRWTVDNITASTGGDLTLVGISDYADDLTAAVTAIGATESTLFMDADSVITGNTTIPSTLKLLWLSSRPVSGAHTLTINGGIEAGPYEIFDSTVTVEGSPVAKKLSSEWWDVTGGGTTDDTTALIAAITSAVLAKITLVISNTPLISSVITFPDDLSVEFAGAPGNFSGQYPSSYLIKDAAMSAVGILVSGQSVSVKNGGVVGEVGNAGDNIQISGHSCRWDNLFSTLSGNDGLRIGEAATGVPNSNHFVLHSPCCTNNVRHGINIDDDEAGGAPNANAGTIISPFCSTNGSHGMYINNAFGNTIIGILSQSNVGKGVYLDERSVSNTFVGGDLESNTSGAGTAGSDLVTVTSVLAAGGQYGGNSFLNTNIGTPPTDNATLTSCGWVGFDGFGAASGTGTINGKGTWTGTIAGDSTAGTNTYTTQNCKWYKNGEVVTAFFDLELSGNSVAMVGDLIISGLPFAVRTGSLGAPAFALVSYITFPGSTTVLIGALDGTNIVLYAYGDNTGSTAIPVANIGASTGRLKGVVIYETPAVS